MHREAPKHAPVFKEAHFHGSAFYMQSLLNFFSSADFEIPLNFAYCNCSEREGWKDKRQISCFQNSCLHLFHFSFQLWEAAEGSLAGVLPALW